LPSRGSFLARAVEVIKNRHLFGSDDFALFIFLPDKPTVILPAIHHIICVNYIVYYLEDYHIAFFKEDKTAGVSGDIFPCEPWA